METRLPDDLSNQQLDSFLNDLRQALAAHVTHLLGVVFGLRFPAAPTVPGPAFDPAQPCRFEELMTRTPRPEIEASPAYQELVARHREIHELTEDCLARSTAGALRPAELTAFLRAVGDFQDFADQLGNDIATALIEVDEVTGLLKRHAMDRELKEEHARARRGKHPFTVAMADIDHFKKINDAHGHPFGDHVLAELSARLTKGLRPYDRVYRYGGEEFLVLLPETSGDKARRVLDRLRERIAAMQIRDGALAVTVSLSIGVAEFRRGRSIARLIEEADAALYRAKQAGRNRVVLAG
jgi:diguanylate cyclase